MIGKTNVQSSVTENTVKDWGFTKSNLTSVDIDEEVVESPEMEYATKGYVDKALSEHTTPEAELVVRIKQDGDNAELSNVKAKVTYGSKEVELSSGAKVLVPVGEDVTVEFPKLEGYKRPDTIKFTMSENGNTVNAVYKGALVTLNVSTFDGKSADGQVVTVQKTVTIDCTPDYDRIDELGVAIMDIYGKFYRDADEWIAAGRPVPNGVAVSDGTHRFCIAMNGIEGYDGVKAGLASVIPQQMLKAYEFSSYKDIQTWGFPSLVDNLSGYDGTGITPELAKKTFTRNLGAYKFITDNYPESEMESIRSFINSNIDMAISFRDASMLCWFETFPNGHYGYLGSSGEWYLASTLNTKIDSLLRSIGGKPLSDISYPVYWTGTGVELDISDDGAPIGAVYTCPYVNAYTMNLETGDIIEKKTGELELAIHDGAYAGLRAFCSLEPKHQTITTLERLVVKDGKVTFHTPYEAVNSVLLSDKEGYITPERLEFQADGYNNTVDVEYINAPAMVEMTINYDIMINSEESPINITIEFTDSNGKIQGKHVFSGLDTYEVHTLSQNLTAEEGSEITAVAKVYSNYDDSYMGEAELTGDTSFVSTDGGIYNITARGDL